MNASTRRFSKALSNSTRVMPCQWDCEWMSTWRETLDEIGHRDAGNGQRFGEVPGCNRTESASQKLRGVYADRSRETTLFEQQ